MQKWEYLTVRRTRLVQPTDKKDNPYYTTGEWRTLVDNEWKIGFNLPIYLHQLGEQGLELVSVIAECDFAGGVSTIYGFTASLVGGGQTNGEFRDFAGLTTDEKLYFKRPME